MEQEQQKSLGIPEGRIGTWLKNAETGNLYTGKDPGKQSQAMNIAEELNALRRRIKEQDK